MEPSSSLLGFEEEAKVSSSSARRLVPWLNWHEWLFVKHALFSDSPHSALKRISAWRSRASLPVLIEVTASIIEIQLKDPCFRQDESNDASLSEEMLAMLYCMAIMRLVNGVIEKTRKKEVASIAVAADAIGIPRMLIDIRHEGSHRELPSLKIVRSASIKALDWLKSYYWEPQSKAIPFQGEGLGEVKKEIKSKIRELAICLKVNGSAQSSSSLLKGKRPKKQISKILKYVLRLYSSFSSEIVSVLLEYLLKALSSSELEGNADDASNGLTTQNVLADWKLILLKLCNKEPEILLNLLKEVLDMIETRENMKYAEDNPNIGISHSRPEIQQRDYLSSLFAWLVGILSKVPSAAANMPKRVLHELLRKCLLISRLCNKQLVDSALQLAELMNDSYLKEKVRKFSLISLSNLDSADDQSSLLTSKNILKFEESILEATKKLELVKQQIMKNKKPTAMDCDTKKSQTWTLAKSWNPCPIGMLPRTVGSSGYLPVLNVIDDEKQNQLLESKENWKLIPHGNKRDATLDLPQLDNSTVKKMRKTKEFSESNNELPMQVVKGCLLVGGVLKKLTEEELLAIESSVRILV
ncbi:pre-rRNA-processing protein las1 isoform X4 [Cajanus cajan]|uniref:pre-rRNA-processing protein las1 isoform X4 n=1 Tax=Cajanus cajan TaxID=3821 RepID=UPI00098DA205|nr:pre-rRNA-processing protein las1 isoform X4 [Cajanus cajan]